MLEHIADRLVPDALGGFEPKLRSLCSAVTVNTVTPTGNVDTKVFEVAASAAGDIAAVLPHGFGAAPNIGQVQIVPLTADCYVKQFCVGTIDATNVNLVMTNAGGTAPVSCRVIVKRHSIGL